MTLISIVCVRSGGAVVSSQCLLLSWALLGTSLPAVDQVALSLYDAPALHYDGVAQYPLQPPVGHSQLLGAFLHGLLERGRRHQLCGCKEEETRHGIHDNFFCPFCIGTCKHNHGPHSRNELSEHTLVLAFSLPLFNLRFEKVAKPVVHLLGRCV